MLYCCLAKFDTICSLINYCNVDLHESEITSRLQSTEEKDNVTLCYSQNSNCIHVNLKGHKVVYIKLSLLILVGATQFVKTAAYRLRWLGWSLVKSEKNNPDDVVVMSSSSSQHGLGDYNSLGH